MSESVQIALITALTTIMGLGLTTGLPLYFAHKKLNHITVLTNSTATAANALIKKLQGEKDVLEKAALDRQIADDVDAVTRGL